MNIQTFNLSDPAAGALGNLNIPIAPGLWALPILAVWDITSAGGFEQPSIVFQETAETVFVGVVGPLCAEVNIGVSASLDVATSPQSFNNNATNTGLIVNTAADPIAVTIQLPRYPFQRNFVCVIGAINLQGGSQVSSVRVVVAFGTLEELLASF